MAFAPIHYAVPADGEILRYGCSVFLPAVRPEESERGLPSELTEYNHFRQIRLHDSEPGPVPMSPSLSDEDKMSLTQRISANVITRDFTEGMGLRWRTR